MSDYLRKFSKKVEMILMGYSGAQGTLIHEKKLKLKISCQTPFTSSTLTLKYSDLKCTLCARRALLTFSPYLLGVASTVPPRFLQARDGHLASPPPAVRHAHI
jgi:hypothetical protein